MTTKLVGYTEKDFELDEKVSFMYHGKVRQVEVKEVHYWGIKGVNLVDGVTTEKGWTVSYRFDKMTHLYRLRLA